MASLCREFGISRKTGYKIYERYEQCGLDGLSDRTRRPYRPWETFAWGGAIHAAVRWRPIGKGLQNVPKLFLLIRSADTD